MVVLDRWFINFCFTFSVPILQIFHFVGIMKNIYLLKYILKKVFVDKINLQEIEKIILSNCNIIEKKTNII